MNANTQCEPVLDDNWWFETGEKMKGVVARMLDDLKVGLGFGEISQVFHDHAVEIVRNLGDSLNQSIKEKRYDDSRKIFKELKFWSRMCLIDRETHADPLEAS